MNTSTDYIAAYAADRPVDPKRSALLIVDMQYATGHRDGFLARKMKDAGSSTTDWRFERIHSCVIPNTLKLKAAMRACGGQIIYVTIGAAKPDCMDAPVHMRKLFLDSGNYLGAPEHRIIEELAPAPEDHIIRKTTNGAFASTGIDHLLRSLDVECLFMVGVSTNMCVETTAREAADRGYAVSIVEDACATTFKDLHEGTLRNFQRLFGTVRSTEQSIDLLS